MTILFNRSQTLAEMSSWEIPSPRAIAERACSIDETTSGVNSSILGWRSRQGEPEWIDDKGFQQSLGRRNLFFGNASRQLK